MDYRKEKNIIYVARDDGKEYRIDINAGIIYGLRGNALKWIPPEIHQAINNAYLARENNFAIYAIFGLFDYWKAREGSAWVENLPHKAEILKLADKLVSLDLMDSENLRWLKNCSPASGEFISKHLGNYAKAYADKALSIEDYLKMQEYKTLCEHYHLNNIHFSANEQHFLSRLMEEKFSEQFITTAINWTREGLLDIARYDYEARSVIGDYLDYCNILQVAPHKKNIGTHFREVTITYMANKDEYDDKMIKKHQMSVYNALHFASGKFETIVPMTAHEFIAEGEKQHNCVGRIYLPRVISGSTHIVFVRSRDDMDRSYITCEVNNRGEIVQYLASCNQRVVCADAISFRDEYQRHLIEYFE